jgi:hypothetical protein
MTHVKKNLPDLPLSEARTPERLIAGIVAGLTLGMMREIVLVVLEGSEYSRWFFPGWWLW